MNTAPRTFAVALAGAALGGVLGATAANGSTGSFPAPGTVTGSGGGQNPSLLTPGPGRGSGGGTLLDGFRLAPGTGTGSGGGQTVVVPGTVGPAGGCSSFCSVVPNAPNCAETTCTVAPDGRVTRADGTEVIDLQDLTDHELDDQRYIDRRIAEWDAYVAERDADRGSRR